MHDIRAIRENPQAYAAALSRRPTVDGASEIAAINGRTDGRIQDSDWEEARRELTGSVEADPTAGTEGWDSTIGGRGKVAPESPGEDTDEEGHSTSAQLVEQGLQEAEHDTMLRASKRPIRIPIPIPNP